MSYKNSLIRTKKGRPFKTALNNNQQTTLEQG